MMKIYRYILALLLICSFLFVLPKEVVAQEADYQCIGNSLAEYMNEVVEKAGGLDHVKLFSPAFNMTNDIGTQIATEMINAGANFNDLYGIAGNAYNCCGNTVTGHVDKFLDEINTPLANPKKVLITETGIISGTVDDLAGEIYKIKSRPAVYYGALLFNALGGRDELGTGEVNWEAFELTDAQIETLCNGDCSKLGVNSAIYYRGDDDYYSKAGNGPGGLNMQYTLSIANLDNSTVEGVRFAHSKGLTPVIRIGTANDTTGPSAYDYASFLISLDSQITEDVYAIAGPNEPQSECWAYASECGCDGTKPPGPGTSGMGKRPIYEGFELGQYMCKVDSPDDIVDIKKGESEFHPLRPYPVNACDPLIPQSLPEATNNIRNKYNTYACGTSINFKHKVSFDPYFDPAEIGVGGSVESEVTGETYDETYCIPDPSDYTCTDAPCPEVTCYKTIRYTVETDFRDSNIGILGNTQNELSDRQKVNNYLSWYFVGTPQTGDHEPLDKLSIKDMDRLVNYAGPLRKLLPFDAQNAMRSAVAVSYRTGGTENKYADLHDYKVGCRDKLTLDEVKDFLEAIFSTYFDSIIFMLEFVGWQTENFMDLGITFVKLAQRPHLFEPEYRSELIDFLNSEGQNDLARHKEFINSIREIGRAHIYLLGSLLTTLDQDHAISCVSGIYEVIRLSSYQDKTYTDGGKLPPDPLDYDNFDEFWYAYNNWRGYTNIPIAGPRDIIVNPFVNLNHWAELFPHIPLGGLEDIAGEAFPSGGGVGVGPQGNTAVPQFNIIEAEKASAN